MDVYPGKDVILYHNSSCDWRYRYSSSGYVRYDGVGPAYYFTVPEDATGSATLGVNKGTFTFYGGDASADYFVPGLSTWAVNIPQFGNTYKGVINFVGYDTDAITSAKVIDKYGNALVHGNVAIPGVNGGTYLFGNTFRADPGSKVVVYHSSSRRWYYNLNYVTESNKDRCTNLGVGAAVHFIIPSNQENGCAFAIHGWSSGDLLSQNSNTGPIRDVVVSAGE